MMEAWGEVYICVHLKTCLSLYIHAYGASLLTRTLDFFFFETILIMEDSIITHHNMLDVD